MKNQTTKDRDEDKEIDWIKKLKELSQSANAIIAVPESSSESDSSEENYGSSYNSEFDESEEELDCSCSSSYGCSSWSLPFNNVSYISFSCQLYFVLLVYKIGYISLFYFTEWPSVR